MDYSIRRFPDSSVPGCCPSRCRFPYRFRYRCSGASPALPMPSRMSCALGTWLLLPGCDPACLSALRVPDASRLPWFFARAGRCIFRAGEPWAPGEYDVVFPGTAAFARGYSFFFVPPSLPSSFEESLNSLTPRPRPRISSGIFLPPNRSNTTNRISINSVGPRNRGMMNMSWYVRVFGVCVFRPGFPVVFPETGTALRTNVLRISETPPSGVKKSGVHPKHPARTVFRESVI